MTDAISVDIQQVQTQIADLFNEVGSIKADTIGIADLLLETKIIAQSRADEIGKMIELLAMIQAEITPLLKSLESNPMLKMLFGGKGKTND